MEEHNIDWFFSIPSVPCLACYSPSNGFILPKMIKVQMNRELQVSVYNDIIEKCSPFLPPNNSELSFKQIECELFSPSEVIQRTECEDEPRFVDKEAYYYLTKQDFIIFLDSIDYLLRLDFGIDTPTQENRDSFFYAYIEMARRGFVCLYPYKDPGGSEIIRYMIIGLPNQSRLKEKQENTFATRQLNRFPIIDVCLSFVQKNNLYDKIDSNQVIALSRE